MAKRFRQSSQQPRRIITQQSLQLQHPLRKNLHLKTIAAIETNKYSNLQGILEEAKVLSSKGLVRQSEMLIQTVLKQDPENK